MNIKLRSLLVAFIAISLFFLPFFWFHTGEVDLGGDSSRLYFYDPGAFLKNYAFFGVSPSAYGVENIGYFMVPFVLLLVGMKLIFSSPTLLIAVFHGLNFSVAFLSCYFIMKELQPAAKGKKNEAYDIASIIAGLFYVFSQVSILGWDKVLVTHNQFFLNPLLFLFLLKYFKTDKLLYLTGALLITFLFSPNFSFVAAPGFFAFYPLSFLFLFLYRLVILKRRIIVKHLMLFMVALV